MKRKNEIKAAKKELKQRFGYLNENDIALLTSNPDKLSNIISDTSGYSAEEVFRILNQVTFRYQQNSFVHE